MPGHHTWLGLFEIRSLPMPAQRPAVLKGSKTQAKDKGKEKEEPKTDESSSPAHYLYAVEVGSEAASLKSNQLFALRTQTNLFRWVGSLAPPASPAVESLLQSMAETAQVATVAEGEEPADFWLPLGGKGDYTGRDFWRAHPTPARLFKFTSLLADFACFEVKRYTQVRTKTAAFPLFFLFLF